MNKLDYDQLASEYARHRQVQPAVLRALLQGANLRPDSRVLEVGCGTGNYLLALQAATGCDGWGVDPSAEMLARARSRASAPRPHMDVTRFDLGRAEQLVCPDGYFSLVFSVDVIHHVGGPPECGGGRRDYHREAFRVLKPGGRFCTVTDSEEIIRRRQPLSVYFPETIPVELQRYPSVPDLLALMAEAGFANLRTETVEFAYPLTDIQMYRERAFSSLHLIAPEAFERGIQRMQADLRAGPIEGVSRYILLWGDK